MMTQYWIGVAAAQHVKVAVSEGFCMFAHGQHSAARLLFPGDGFAYYSPKQGMKDGDAVRAFTAIGTVLEGNPREREMMPGKVGWCRNARYETGNQANIYPLLDTLSFVKNRSHWGMYFRKSLFKVSHDDFLLIANAMGCSEQF